MRDQDSALYRYLPMSITLLIWGFMGVPASWALAEMAPVQLLLLRTALAVVVLAPCALLLEGSLLPARGDRLTAVLEGMVGVLGNNLCYFYAIRHTSLTNIAIIFATTPLQTALLARVFLGEKLTPRRLLGIALALCGVVALMSRGDVTLLTRLRLNRGDIYELGAGFCCAVMTVLGRRIRHTGPITVTLCNMTSSCAVIALVIAFVGLPLNFAMSQRALLSLLYVGIGASGCAYACQQLSISRIGAGATSAFLNANPALGILAAVLFMGEKISPFQVVCAVVIGMGICLNVGEKSTK